MEHRRASGRPATGLVVEKVRAFGTAGPNYPFMSSTPNNPAVRSGPGNGIPRVLVATTALLSFISFWRAAAIVLNDLASSAYYAGGEAEGYIGKAAPWFILGIMLFSYAVRAVYVESCSMFVRGGVYRAVKQSLGGGLAKFSVSALMFDYILKIGRASC